MRFWLNGKVRDDPSGVLAATDRGFLLADGLFETILIRCKKPVFWQAHMDRLRHSCAAFDLPLPYGDEALLAAAMSVIGKHETGSIRLTVSRGGGVRGLVPPCADEVDPTILLTFSPPPPKTSTGPVRCILAQSLRVSTSFSARHKTLAYTDAVYERQRASRAGAEDVVFLNEHVRVTCASVGNIFVIRKGQLLTPPVADGCLPGITRATLLAVAGQAGLVPLEQSLGPADLEQGFLITNSLIGIRAAALSPYPAQLPGDLLESLIRVYDAAIKADISGFA